MTSPKIGGNNGSNSSYVGTFVKIFINGVLHGDRQPGQSFAACVDQNIQSTTFGPVDPSKVLNPTLVKAEATAGVASINVPLGSSSDGSAGVSINGLQTAAGVNYSYDGDGRRVQKSNGKLYWYGMSSEPLAESDLSGNLSDEYVFFGARRVARRNVSSGSIYYYFADQLGTSRVIVQAGQTTACYEADFYPFGGERAVTNTCPQNYKFNGKERDTESGADYFGARYLSSSFGRWFSADWSASPEPVPYADFSNPQTLNLYAFVLNSPITHADLDGHTQGYVLVRAGDEYFAQGIAEPALGSGLGSMGPTTDEPEAPANNQAQQAAQPQNQNQDQTQQNQQTQNNQQSTTQQPATPAQSGINPNYKLSTADLLLKKASDFSAGAGDCLTGRCLFLGTSLTEKARQLNGADSVVDKGSGAYLGGKITGAAVGTGIVSLAAANAAVGLESKVAIHGAHHAFGYLGGARLAHIQVILWIAGQKGSDLSMRIPLPWK